MGLGNSWTIPMKCPVSIQPPKLVEELRSKGKGIKYWATDQLKIVRRSKKKSLIILWLLDWMQGTSLIMSMEFLINVKEKLLTI